MEKFVIKRDSWHWKLYSALLYYPPKNFCRYFWSITFLVTFAMIIATLALVIAFSMASALLAVFDVTSFWLVEEFAPLGLALYIFAFVIFILFLIQKAIDKSVEMYYYKRLRKPNPTKQKGLLYTKYKSFKEKVCPLVELED